MIERSRSVPDSFPIDAIAFADQVLNFLRLVVVADQPDDNRRVPGVTGVQDPADLFVAGDERFRLVDQQSRV
jgi:hypothetical protein